VLVMNSSSICLQPIVRVDGKAIGAGLSGPIYRRLLAAWSKEVGVDIPNQARQFANR
jgi:branched-chain amino acid aminotransferase